MRNYIYNIIAHLFQKRKYFFENLSFYVKKEGNLQNTVAKIVLICYNKYMYADFSEAKICVNPHEIVIICK